MKTLELSNLHGWDGERLEKESPFELTEEGRTIAIVVNAQTFNELRSQDSVTTLKTACSVLASGRRKTQREAIKEWRDKVAKDERDKAEREGSMGIHGQELTPDEEHPNETEQEPVEEKTAAA